MRKYTVCFLIVTHKHWMAFHKESKTHLELGTSSNYTMSWSQSARRFLWFCAEFIKISCCCFMYSFHRMLHRKDWKLAPGLRVSWLRCLFILFCELLRRFVWFWTATSIERQSLLVENYLTACLHAQTSLKSTFQQVCDDAVALLFCLCSSFRICIGVQTDERQ